MIQRKQTLWLIIAILCLIACVALPIGSWQGDKLGDTIINWSCLGTSQDGSFSIQPVPAILLTIAVVFNIVAIFTYRRRVLQAKLTVVSIVALLAWYIVYALGATGTMFAQGHFTPQMAAALPAVAIIMGFMARHGILADEKLVRSMDRIR